MACRSMEGQTHHGTCMDTVGTDRLQREHQEAAILESGVDIAAKVLEWGSKQPGSNKTYSLLRFPGMTTSDNGLQKSSSFTCPRKLFWAMMGTAFPGVREMVLKMSFQMAVSFFSLAPLLVPWMERTPISSAVDEGLNTLLGGYGT